VIDHLGISWRANRYSPVFIGGVNRTLGIRYLVYSTLHGPMIVNDKTSYKNEFY
jgi:hypothetical protein